jgi:hypothetical protein
VRAAVTASVLLVLSGCRQADSIIFLRVGAQAPLAPVSRLRVVAGNDGLSDTKFFPETADPAHPVNLPTSLVLVVPRTRDGSAHVMVDALDSGDHVLGSGVTDVPLMRGGRADGQVVLTTGATVVGDGGTGDATAADATAAASADAAQDVGVADVDAALDAGAEAAASGADSAMDLPAPVWTATNPPPLPQMGYTFISTVLSDRCWVKGGVPNCFNNKFDFPGNDYRQFSLYGGFGDTWCLIRNDDSVACGRVPNPPPATSMVLGPYWFCLHETTGRFACVGAYRHEEVTALFEPFNEAMKSLMLTPIDYAGAGPGDADGICGITDAGKLVCDRPVNDQAAAWTGIADAVLTKASVCGLFTDGHIVCAKNNHSTDNDAPDVIPGGDYVRLAIANGTTPIALTATGDAVYFAQDSLGTWKAKVAIQGELVYLLSAGALAARPPSGQPTICGLTFDGRVKCNDPAFQFGN